MKFFNTEFSKEYVNEAIYILPFVVYSDEVNCGKILWFGWLRWLFGISFNK